MPSGILREAPLREGPAADTCRVTCAEVLGPNAVTSQLADCYAKMAETEIGHVNSLHEHAVRLIKAKKSAGTEVPSAMQAV